MENNDGKLHIISGKFQNSEKFQNNAINNVKQISLNHVITIIILLVVILLILLGYSWSAYTANVCQLVFMSVFSQFKNHQSINYASTYNNDKDFKSGLHAVLPSVFLLRIERSDSGRSRM